MKRYAPLLTLLAVAALALVLLVANRAADPSNTADATAAPAAPATSEAPAAAPPPTETASPPVVAQAAFAGRSSGNEVTVAIAVKDGRAVAYVCDGKKVEAWLEGTLAGDTLSLKGAGDATITGTVDEAKSLGTVAVGGKQWPYAAKLVNAPEGLYEGRADVRGVATRVGWIVVDNSVTGSGNANGVPIDAPPFDPASPGSTTDRRRPHERPHGQRRRHRGGEAMSAATPEPTARASRSGSTAVLIAAAVGSLVAVGLGVYGRFHEPTFFAINVGGFSSGVAAKAWLATGAFVLAVVQLVTAMRMYGKLGSGPAPSWSGTLHRWSGRAAVLLTVPVAVHCLYALGFETSTPRVVVHSLFGCFFYGAFVAKMLLLRASGAPGWALPVFGGAVFTALTSLWLTSSVWFFTTTGLTF